MYNFDQALDRRNGDSLKWNKYAGRDILPLWVADMDFAVPPPVLEALQRRIAQGCLGYPVPWQGLVDTVLGHLQRAYAWSVKPEWLVWLPGLVTGLNVACRAVEGDVIAAVPRGQRDLRRSRRDLRKVRQQQLALFAPALRM